MKKQITECHSGISLYYREDENAKLIVVCDDTDVFMLLLTHKAELTNTVLMESPIKGRIVVEIAQTAEKQACIVDKILAVHEFSCSYIVAGGFGIGN